MAKIESQVWKQLHSKEQYCDLEVVAGKSAARLKTHKLVLALSSPVLAELLFPTKPETPKVFQRREPLDVLLLENEDPEIVKILLSFIYTDEATITDANVMAVLNASKTYELKRLTALCTKHLSKIGEDMALTLYTTLPEGEERDIVQKVIEQKTALITKLPDFLKLDEKTLIGLISNDNISISELFLYKACLQWAEAQLKAQDPAVQITPQLLRKRLEHVLPLIRFPLMGMKAFVTDVAEAGILTEEEVLAIFTYFAANPKGPAASAPSTGSATSTTTATASADSDEVEPSATVMPFPSNARKGVPVEEEEKPEEYYDLGFNLFD